MDKKEILLAYKAGKFTTAEVREKLDQLKKQSMSCPLSEGQKGLWMLQKMDPAMSAYNVPICFRMPWGLNPELFQQACRFLLEQHSIFTTVIEEDREGPCQTTRPEQPLAFNQEDISKLTGTEIFPYLRKKAREPFSLESGPLIRFHLFSRVNLEYLILIVIHHIIFDGSSTLLFMKTLLAGYQDLVQGRKPAAVSSGTSYADFVEWERKMLKSKEGEEHRRYWAQQLAGTLSVLELPADHPRSSTPSFAGQVLITPLSPELSREIRSCATAQALNLSVIFLGIFKLLLYRYTGQGDLIVGLPTAGRPLERFEPLIGYFVNMIAVRSQIAGMKPCLQFLRELQLTLVEALDHAVYPFPALVRELNVPRTQGNSPVFQVAFAYQNYLLASELQHFREQYQNALSIEFPEEIHQEGEFELTLEVIEREEGFTLLFKYNPDLFEASTISRMMEHIINLIKAVVENPNLTLDEYSFISGEERQFILRDRNATRQDYPKDRCIHELFEEQAQKTPDALAVIDEEKSLTYRELDEKSARLAIYLQSQGVGPDCLVGICMDRSLEMIVGLLGILKAGGAYLPLDPGYPAERLEYMIRDSQAPVILTQSKPGSLLTGNNSTVIYLDRDWEKIEKAVKGRKRLKREVRPRNLVYVIYTSGSTGQPKGVMIEHRGLVNYIWWARRMYLKNENEVFPFYSSLSFDLTVTSIFTPLISGNQMVIYRSNEEEHVLFRIMKENKVTIVKLTPAHLSLLKDMDNHNSSVKRFIVGGEDLKVSLAASIHESFGGKIEIYNEYGPTETVVGCMIYRYDHSKDQSVSVPIGIPGANAQIYLLDRRLQPVPVNVAGEMYIAGDGLARGYLNRPDLTAEKFIPNPFNSLEFRVYSLELNDNNTNSQLLTLNSQLYKTGDLARWLPGGNMEFLGRIDHQVKVRGYRIELGEIESRLDHYPEIETSAVIVKEQEGRKRLVAYYVRKAQEGQNIAPFELSRLPDYLKNSLPEYMIPAFFIQVDKIPLTPNGKIDRQELTSRRITLPKREKISIPQSQIEEKVMGIWKDLLHVDDLSTEDGFFDVGGDSILAVTVAKRIKTECDCDFTVTTLFKYPNVREISKYIEVTQNRVAASMEEDHAPPEYACSNTGDQILSQDRQRTAYPDYYQESCAIIGISCHFPGAENYREFWNNLREGKESVRFLSEEELRRFNLPEEIRRDPHYVPIRAAMEKKDLFDPGFFNIAPRDAEMMDPQLRLLLMHSWKAVEDAGYVPRQIPETGVFISAANSFYQAWLLRNSRTRCSFQVMENSDQYLLTILAQGGTIPTMISYKLGFKGPSYCIQSNCSSSLTGLYSAYQCLRSGEAKYALVGAATIYPFSNLGYLHQPGLNLSGDGHCKAFDASADGMIGGEGVAVIVLKRACDAIADGDHIYAVLRGISINNDGAEKVGFYAPSVNGQAEVIRKTLDLTKIHPKSISYVEAHGTGTKLGDPIEFAALSDVYQKYTVKKQFCGLGSVKTNIGHLDTAAGLAGLIKVALSLYHREIPPSVNFQAPNPSIDFPDSPFYMVEKLRKWENTEVPRRAALSSFGIGGTNTHAILEEYPTVNLQKDFREEFPPGRVSYLIPLSAKNKERLQASVNNLADYLKTAHDSVPDLHLSDIAYTLQLGRETLESRVIFLVDGIGALRQMLEQYLGGKEKIAGCFQGEVKKSQDVIRFLENDEDTQEIINQWIAKGKIQKLAEFWVKGFDLDWGTLYKGPKPRRISLPTYPFAEERYWAPEINLNYDINGGLPPGGELRSGINISPADARVILSGREQNAGYTEVEKRVAEVWGRELGLKEINVYDHFYEMGGNSLIAVKLEIEMGKNGLPVDVADFDKYPSVAEISAFISEKFENELTGKKILDNIEPFNDIYYKNCFYNDFFPVLRYFDRDLIPFLVNDVAIYGRSREKEAELLTVCYKSKIALEQLLRDRNIAMITKLHSENIINDLTLAISQNRPVIIWIDGYDVPFREDLYHKEHWSHSWLVFGYDQTQQMFRIIEHRHRGSLTYKKYEVSYRDLENAYLGRRTNNLLDINDPSYYEFYLENSGNTPRENPDELKKIFAANMARHKAEILEGLKEIKVFEKSFRKLVSQESEFLKNIDRIIEMFNDVINARKADLYKVQLLFGKKEDLNGLLDRVIKSWDFIRLKLARCLYTLSFDGKSLEAVLEKLSNIYEYEREYHCLLLTVLEEILQKER